MDRQQWTRACQGPRTLVHKGCELSYRVDGSGPPVVFIQGTGLHGAGWRPQVDELQSSFACLTFDNRGMGASQPVGCAVTVAQMAEDALQLLDAVDWPSAHVVGHSLGGLIAIHMALVARARVRTLALLCTFARGRDAAPLTGSMLWTGVRTRVGTRRQRRRAFLQLVLTPDELTSVDIDRVAADLAPYFGHDLADHPAIEMTQLRAMRAYDATARVHELAGIPTLVVTAEHDRIAPPRLGEALARAVRGSRHHHFARAAHGLPIRRAADVNAVLRHHFTRGNTDDAGSID
jgi:pimeloyl-ACP methyl ester carboxylesterase